jgi:gliding motility associated protien GldN
MRYGCILGLFLAQFNYFGAQILEPYALAREIPEPHIRQADIMWGREVYSLIDLRQKFNLPLYYPIENQANRHSLIQIIRKGLESGTLRPFNDAKCTQLMNPHDALMIGRTIDTIMVAKPNPPYELYPMVLIENFRNEEVIHFKIREFWVFDKQQSSLRYFALSICPVLNRFDPNTGELRGQLEMFWIHFADLFPYMTQFPFYNTQNSQSTLHFGQAFKQRLFHSVVYKEDNVYDRPIHSYSRGKEAIEIGIGVMEKIRRFEEDLWER